LAVLSQCRFLVWRLEKRCITAIETIQPGCHHDVKYAFFDGMKRPVLVCTEFTMVLVCQRLKAKLFDTPGTPRQYKFRVTGYNSCVWSICSSNFPSDSLCLIVANSLPQQCIYWNITN
jgi:signal recognition particle receptor subunit beta